MLNPEAKQNPQDLRIILQNEFIRRAKQNSQYSLRAYARSLKIESSALSKILSGKRMISRPMYLHLGKALGFSQKDLESSFDLPLDSRKARISQYQKLSLALFAVISDWYHNAIIELAKTKNFDSDPASIANRLGITSHQAKQALDRLEQVGILKKTFDKKYCLQSEANANDGAGSTVTTPALRKLQRQILEKSLSALKDIPIELRSHTGMTMAIDPRLLPKAKESIKKFRRKLCEDLQRSSQLTEVYQLSVSLFPLTKVHKGEKI